MATAIPFAQTLRRITLADLTHEEVNDALTSWMRHVGRVREVVSIRMAGDVGKYICTLADGPHRFTGRGADTVSAIADALDAAGAFE